MTWQKMDTAPQDGTYVDLWIGGRRYCDCRWGYPIAGYSRDGHPLYSDKLTWITQNEFMQAPPSLWHPAIPQPGLDPADDE